MSAGGTGRRLLLCKLGAASFGGAMTQPSPDRSHPNHTIKVCLEVVRNLRKKQRKPGLPLGAAPIPLVVPHRVEG